MTCGYVKGTLVARAASLFGSSGNMRILLLILLVVSRSLAIAVALLIFIARLYVVRTGS